MLPYSTYADIIKSPEVEGISVVNESKPSSVQYAAIMAETFEELAYLLR